MERTETSITVVWDPPVQQAHSISTKCNLTYGVYTSVNGGPRVKIHHVDETKTVILSKLHYMMNHIWKAHLKYK